MDDVTGGRWDIHQSFVLKNKLVVAVETVMVVVVVVVVAIVVVM